MRTSNIKTPSFVAGQVVMIRPLSFSSNSDTLDSNAFQKKADEVEKSIILQRAQKEFDQFQKKLIDAGIKVSGFTEKIENNTPDALFPNNWFCHLPDQRVFVFPMYPPNRRNEYREDIIENLRPKEVLDLRYLEKQSLFLEGTGSLILDHENKVGYACRSSRTSSEAVKIFSNLSGYRIFEFEALDQQGVPIYHTNVMMALSPQHAVINLNSISDANSRRHIEYELIKRGKKLIDINHSEMQSFCGNILFLRNENLKAFWVCSEKAYKNLRPDLKKQLSEEADFIFSDLNTIETYGGGGARCLLAEVF